jgi:predicted RNA-binding Zn ribbon-like protein
MSFPEALVNVPGQVNQVELLAGVLCLDFVNTVEPRISSHPGEPSRNYLTCYQDLIAWSLHAGALSEEVARHLLTEAEKHPESAREALDQAVQFREVIYRIFLAIARNQEVNALDLDTLSAVSAQAMRHARLRASGNAFALTWVQHATDLLYPLWPITLSAVELLLQGEMQRIKECARGGEGCGWLFHDTSKNSSRRWCSMRGCGSQAKERRRGKRKRSSPHLDV